MRCVVVCVLLLTCICISVVLFVFSMSDWFVCCVVLAACCAFFCVCVTTVMMVVLVSGVLACWHTAPIPTIELSLANINLCVCKHGSPQC